MFATYSEKLLGSWDNVSNHQSSSEWIDDVFVVWVEDKSIYDFAYSLENYCEYGLVGWLTLKSNDSLKFKFLFHYSQLFVCSFECVKSSIKILFISKL